MAGCSMSAYGKAVKFLGVGLFLQLIVPAWAATNRIEPDDYVEGTVLNDISPIVDLRTYDGVIYAISPPTSAYTLIPALFPSQRMKTLISSAATSRQPAPKASLMPASSFLRNRGNWACTF